MATEPAHIRARDTMSSTEHKATVERMWQALAAMDWEAMKACMHPDIHYIDVPTDDPVFAFAVLCL